MPQGDAGPSVAVNLMPSFSSGRSSPVLITTSESILIHFLHLRCASGVCGSAKPSIFGSLQPFILDMHRPILSISSPKCALSRLRLLGSKFQLRWSQIAIQGSRCLSVVAARITAVFRASEPVSLLPTTKHHSACRLTYSSFPRSTCFLQCLIPGRRCSFATTVPRVQLQLN